MAGEDFLDDTVWHRRLLDGFIRMEFAAPSRGCERCIFNTGKHQSRQSSRGRIYEDEDEKKKINAINESRLRTY